MKVSRRNFGKLCAGGLVLLATRGRGASAPAPSSTGPARILSLSGLDPACDAFAACLRRCPLVAPVMPGYEGEVDEIEAVRKVLAGVAPGTRVAGPRFVAGMVGAHAYPVLETLLRDARAALIVRGQHVRRRGHERHEFLTTPRGAGAGGAFAALLAGTLAGGGVGERCLGEGSPEPAVAYPPPVVPLTRIQALAVVYQNIMAPGAAVSPRSPAGADIRLNHDSFVFAV
jgi:hypothetical protein